jgi:hypothetical protein
MGTDKYSLDAAKTGFHGEIRVTPILLASDARSELPSGGVASQLYQRKSVVIQNTGSGTIWVGGSNVGYGATYGGATLAQCSGIELASGGDFDMDVGRSRAYAFNPNATSVVVRLLEIA